MPRSTSHTSPSQSPSSGWVPLCTSKRALLAGRPHVDWACNDHRVCAERRLIGNCVVEARRRGVPPHKVAGYVRRRLGGGVCIFRFRADGSPGCSAPCTLCAREIQRFDLKVCCLLEGGEVFCGRLSDPGAPPAKVTGGQRAWLRWWAACKGGRPQGAPSSRLPAGAGAGDRAIGARSEAARGPSQQAAGGRQGRAGSSNAARAPRRSRSRTAGQSV
ncbi:hypothetical protein ABPG75_000369 [Micractinium tetrahymenae]